MEVSNEEIANGLAIKLIMAMVVCTLFLTVAIVTKVKHHYETIAEQSDRIVRSLDAQTEATKAQALETHRLVIVTACGSPGGEMDESGNIRCYR